MKMKVSRYNRWPRPLNAAGGMFCAVLLLPLTTTQAQEWRLEPEVRLGAEYDDNARLRSQEDQIQEIDGYILEGSLGIGYNTQRSSLKVTPRLRSRVYDETPDVDSDDQFVDFDYDFEGLKSEFRINSSYDREAVRTAERSDADPDIDDPDDIPTDDSGLVFTNDQRQRFRFSPQWQYELTERLSIGAQYTYIDVTYDDAISTFLKDYQDQRIEASLGRMFTERTRGYIGVGARRYENDEGTNDVDGYGAVLGVESDVSQTTTFQAEVGYENTENDATGDSDSSIVGNVNLVRRLETVTMLAQYQRNVAASGSGKVSARDTLNFNLKKQFTERVSAGLGVRAYKTDGIGDQAVTVEDRDQLEFRAEFAVALSRAFSVEADLRHTQLERSGAEGSADSNSIILWLVYKPTPIVN